MQSGCNWTATTSASWISLTRARTGPGSGTIALQRRRQPHAPAAQGDIVLLAGQPADLQHHPGGRRCSRGRVRPACRPTSELDLEGGAGPGRRGRRAARRSRRAGRARGAGGGPRRPPPHRGHGGERRRPRRDLALPAGRRRGARHAAHRGRSGALAGEAEIVFRLSGKPGERIVFAFRVLRLCGAGQSPVPPPWGLAAASRLRPQAPKTPGPGLTVRAETGPY